MHEAHQPSIQFMPFILDDLKLYGANKDQLDSLIQAVRIFSEHIKMSFGLEKVCCLGNENKKER